MPLIRKVILPPDTYTTEQGTFEVTAERNKSWVEKARQMFAKGITLSVPWGHNRKAIPLDPASQDDANFKNSRFNAGLVTGVELDDQNRMVAILDLPGVEERDGKLVSVATLPDGQIVTTAVQATSPGFTKSWTDGTGQQWEDVLAHVALTPEPVWADQPAFEIAFAKRKDAEVFYLALPKDPTTKVASKLSKPPPDKDAEDETEDVVPDPLDGAVPAEKNDDESRCDRLKVLLAKVGCTLPADTTTENIAERLEVALGVLIQKVAADNAKKQAEKQEKDAASQGNQPTEAPSPSMMMSHPVTRRIILDEVDRRKSEAIKRIESLKLRGVPVHEANQMIADVSSVTMSVSKTGQLSRLPIDAELDRLERIMPPAEKFDLLSKTKPLSSPIQKNEGDGEEMVVHKASGLPMPKSTLDSIKEIAHR